MTGADGASYLSRQWVRPLRWGAALVALVVIFTASAQTGVAQVQAAGPEIVYLQPGQPAMNIYILGDVGRPGKWRVTRGAELFDVLAVATPAGTGAAGGTSTRVDIEVYRTSGTGRVLAYENSLDPLIMSSEASMPLQAGDVVRVKAISKRPFNLFQAVQIATSLTSLVLLVINLTSSN